MKSKKVTFNTIHAEMVAKRENKLDMELTPEIVLHITKTLPMQDAIAFVNNVVDICTSDATGEYMPELKDFAVRLVTLMRYAGLPSPADVNKAYAVVMCTDLYERVARVINDSQHFELLEAVNEKIDIIVKMQQSTAAHRVSQLVDAMDAMMTNGSAMMETLNSSETLDALKSLGETLRTADLVVPAAPTEG